MEGLKSLRNIARSPIVLAVIAPVILTACTKNRESVQFAVRMALDGVYKQGEMSCDAAREQVSSELEATGFEKTPDGNLVDGSFVVRTSILNDPESDTAGDLFVVAEDPDGLIIGKTVECNLPGEQK